MRASAWCRGLGFGLGLAIGCGGAPSSLETPRIEALAAEPAPSEAKAPGGPAPGHGGRLFDCWYAAVDSDFVPDDPSTEALDGKGGPFANGTLADENGKPMPNPGHDYRLKNMLGWDLRGSKGIYGPEHLAKPGVLMPSLLSDTDSREHWIERLTRGGDAIPAYGSVLGAADVEALANFMLGIRDGELPQSDDIYALDADAPHHYRLKPGNPERGDKLFSETCARCHGADGTKVLFDDGAYSLGSLARAKGYEVAMKILSGQPGTPMAAQVGGDRETRAADLRDLLAALCDRSRYPLGGASGADVPDGDPRCGDALE